MPFLMSNLNVDAPFLSELEKYSILTAGDIAVISVRFVKRYKLEPEIRIKKLIIYLSL